MAMQNGILLIIRIQLYRVECTKQICMKKMILGLIVLVMCLSSFKANALIFEKTSDLSAYAKKNATSYESMIDIFKDIDSKKLKEVMDSKDEDMCKDYAKPLADRISAYMLSKYSVDLQKEIDGEINEIIAIGVMYIIIEDKTLWKPILDLDEMSFAPKDNNLQLNSYGHIFNETNEYVHLNLYRSGMDVGCMLGVIAGIAGLSDVKGIIRNLELGAVSSATAWAAIRLIFKRVLTIFLVFEAVYGMGGCFGLW